MTLDREEIEFLIQLVQSERAERAEYADGDPLGVAWTARLLARLKSALADLMYEQER